MNAEEVKHALRRRINQNGTPGQPTPWTCIEEFHNIDLWCLAAWTKPAPAARKCKPYPRIAIEVKVSRSDFKAELMKPYKRAWACSHSDQFYIAVPLGLLKDEEIAWKQPDYEPKDFVRLRCPNNCRTSRINSPGRWYYKAPEYVKCEVCKGGYVDKSRVEKESPMVWVPPDVGLIEVDERGCKFTKYAPVNENRLDLHPSQVNILARWISVRPDPYHATLRAAKAPVILKEGLTQAPDSAMLQTNQPGGELVST